MLNVYICILCIHMYMVCIPVYIHLHICVGTCFEVDVGCLLEKLSILHIDICYCVIFYLCSGK